MVQVPNLQFPGEGAIASLPYPGWGKPVPDDTPSNGNGGGNGDNGGTPGAPSFVIPDNFWGFVMIMMGMR
jgi:hypothetical protein